MSPRPDATILVVDEPAVRILIAAILRRAGFTVLGAAGVAEAQQRAAGHPAAIDLLLSDLLMPNGTGRELAHALSQERPEMRRCSRPGIRLTTW